MIYKNKGHKLLDLYITFLKIGSFTIGGGYAMLPIMQTEAVDTKNWCTEEEVTNYITLAQSLPGMFAANVAGSIGNKLAGVLGAFFAVLGVITPSIIIISIFANFYHLITEPGILQDFFNGLRSGVYALIFLACLRIYKNAVNTKAQLFLFVLILFLYFIANIQPFYLMLIGCFSGILYKHIEERLSKK